MKHQEMDAYGFRLRGREVSRLEALSDAVFGFAITLLVVSLEVPRSYEDLLALMAGFPAFGASFAVLLMIWHSHVVFFRRYALTDFLTVLLNSALLFVVVFYIYPLKFLFTLVIAGVMGVGASAASRVSITIEQSITLMIIYASSVVVVFFIIGLMTLHAWRKRHELELDALELHITRTSLQYCAIWIAIALLVMAIAWFGGTRWIGLSGLTFGLLGPVHAIHGYLMAKRAPVRPSTATGPAGNPEQAT
jgi:uncharacterized membrane protein